MWSNSKNITANAEKKCNDQEPISCPKHQTGNGHLVYVQSDVWHTTKENSFILKEKSFVGMVMPD